MRVYLANGVSADFHQYVSDPGQRSANGTAKALSSCLECSRFRMQKVISGAVQVAGWAEMRRDPAKAAKNRCAEPTVRNPFIARPRCRVG